MALISVGNTRTRVAKAFGNELEPSRVFENTDESRGAIAKAVVEALGEADADGRVVIASVNDAVAGRIEAALREAGLEPLKFGRDVPVPIVTSLPDESTVGTDRLLDALGAYARSKQACVVIDAGTAITVDFVDGEGTFHGGAIAPGVRMMLRAMHEQTAALPEVALSPDLLPARPATEDGPLGAPFGKNTSQAMAIGAVSAARGLAHELIDRYAEFYQGYPRVVATGGDAPLLFEHDGLVEVIVPDLTLLGMLEAIKVLEQIDLSGDDEPETERS